MTDTEVVAEGELREWATAHNITSKTVDLLVKDGFTSMDALELLDKEDLSQSKIPRGQQKLLLKSLQPRQATEAEQTTDQTAEVTEATTVAAATCEDGATAPARDQAAGAGPASETERDVYTQLMCEHLRTMQGATATTPTPQSVAGRGHTRAATVTASRFEHCATMPGLWQDPQVHLVSSATGRSCNVHYDVVDFIAKDTVEEEVVAGTQEGRQNIVKSGVKPKLEAITLSQWSIANLAIMYRLLGEGKLGDEGVIDYLSYSTKIYQLTQKYENVSVYFYDREYRKLQASHNFRWGTDIPHLHTMQLTPRAPRNNARPPPNHVRSGQRPGPVTVDGRAICKMLNTSRGCSYVDCKFVHACSFKGCSNTPCHVT
ncbi:hypothetical protein NP493_4089g00002 [Ridgeia piscesae]|uniref:C3H1-type domain-containing protein n=1 Tax=Ridgeia piscesae TaxID=27915 RepID=A0AAD9J2G6_RIDPI|nr:hypothetical protein NP493_4089g00002 [Ridgeia piscesae]